MRYVTRKLSAISVPAMLNVHILCRDKLTSHGAADSSEATVVPIPKRTSTEGSAQQMRVLERAKEREVVEQCGPFRTLQRSLWVGSHCHLASVTDL